LRKFIEITTNVRFLHHMIVINETN